MDSVPIESFSQATEALIAAGHWLDQQGWVPATSGNFSARLESGHLLITVSGQHKGRLTPAGLMLLDGETGQPLQAGLRSSAETALHRAIYRRYPNIQAVLHTHSVRATVLSKQRLAQGAVVLRDYELLKAFAGITTHETTVTVPIFANDQDIDRLNSVVEAYLDHHPACWGYLIAGHGLYSWGESVAEALRHLEAFEALFACELFAGSA